jgi:hypothetical protein
LSLNFNFASWKKTGQEAKERTNNPRVLLPDYFCDEEIDTGEIMGASLEIDEQTIRAGEIEVQFAEQVEKMEPNHPQKNLPDPPNLGHTITNNNLNTSTTTETTNSRPLQNSAVNPTVQPSPEPTAEVETSTDTLMFNVLLDTITRLEDKLEQRLQTMEDKITSPIEPTHHIVQSTPPVLETPTKEPMSNDDLSEEPIMVIPPLAPTHIDKPRSSTQNPIKTPPNTSIVESLQSAAAASKCGFHSVATWVQHLPQTAPKPNDHNIKQTTEPQASVSPPMTEKTSMDETEAAMSVGVNEYKEPAEQEQKPVKSSATIKALNYPHQLSQAIKNTLQQRLNEHHIPVKDAQNLLDLLAGRLQNTDDPIRSVPAYLSSLIKKFKRQDLDLSPLNNQGAIAEHAAQPKRSPEEEHIDQLQWAYRDAMTEYNHFENNFRIIAAREGINLQDYLKSEIAKPIWVGVKQKMEHAHAELHAALANNTATP